MNQFDNWTEALINEAAAGSSSAFERLLGGYRPRLRRIIEARLDTRVARRVDPSDVVQEVLAEAHRRFPDYASDRQLPFYAWLRRLALDQLKQLRRQHVLTQKRSVVRESSLSLSDPAIALLSEHLSSTSPSRVVLQAELHQHVMQALGELEESDRELLVMKYVEQMTLVEIASDLRITLAAAKSRHLRALARIGQRLAELGDDR